SSSTSPLSSRPTIASSSLSARSKLMSFRSGYFSTPVVIPTPFCCTNPDQSRRVHQQLHVDGDRAGQGRQIVTAFEHRHYPSLGIALGHLAKLVRYPGKI